MSTTVAYDGTTYYRLSDGVFADAPYSIRVQVGAPLTDEAASTLAGLVGYAYAKTGGERGNGYTQDSSNSIIYWCDTTKGRAYKHLDEFFADVKTMVVEGSPPRKTKNNTRLIEGLGDVGEIVFYADSVYPPPAPETEPAPTYSGAPGVYTVDNDFYRVGKNERVALFRRSRWQPLTRADERQDALNRVTSRGHKTPVETLASVGRASGVCMVCGRALKDPASAARGIGSGCLKKIG